MPLSASPKAIVTGSGSGLGRALALAIADRGGAVVVSDIDPAGADETVKLLRARGADAHRIDCDVTRFDQVQQLVDEGEQKLGGLDLMVNNAGVAVAGAVGEAPLEDWRWVMEVNLWGVIHGCHVVAPRFAERGRGAILNVASAAGLLVPPTLGPYNVSKAGVVALSETLRAELAPKGVAVTVLCPTFFPTNLMATARAPGDAASFAKRAMDKSRVSADDVARAALRSLDDDELFCIPMRDGRMFWRLKRAAPNRFSKLAAAGPALIKRLSQRRKR